MQLQSLKSPEQIAQETGTDVRDVRVAIATLDEDASVTRFYGLYSADQVERIKQQLPTIVANKAIGASWRKRSANP